jgi:hypothetical protein
MNVENPYESNVESDTYDNKINNFKKTVFSCWRNYKSNNDWLIDLTNPIFKVFTSKPFQIAQFINREEAIILQWQSKCNQKID